MDPVRQKVLLAAARNAVAAHLGVSPVTIDPAEADPPLAEPAGAFVSLHRRGDLRGCIGTFAADKALVETVREMAVAAATRDPRFSPLLPRELDDLEIEISVLSSARPAGADEVTIGRHGLLISRDGRRGVLLPQVATDHGWTAEEFLAHTCRKAGLSPDAWRDPRTRIEVFEADVFS